MTAWGHNNVGQCNVPPGLTGVVALSAGSGHNLALKGRRHCGGLGGVVIIMARPTSLRVTGVVAVAANYSYSLALKSDGAVIEWGINSFPHIPAGLNLRPIFKTPARSITPLLYLLLGG